MLELLYIFILLFLFFIDNIFDVVIVFKDLNCKWDINFFFDMIFMIILF